MNQVRFPFEFIEIVENTVSKGLAPITCYDPWAPRALETIKQSVNDGHPVLIRLHSAASYPSQEFDQYQLDIESHAVLIVGYDDEREAVALIDPWNKQWGGKQGGRWWLSYEALSYLTVDGTMGYSMTLAPLQVQLNPSLNKSGEFSLDFEVGFFVPRGTVMDRESWVIKRIDISCRYDMSTCGTIEICIAGNWVVGEFARAPLPLGVQLASGTIEATVQAEIHGARPYAFRDIVEVNRQIRITPSTKSATIPAICG